MKMLSSFNYISRRSPVASAGAMVASSQPLATQAGLSILAAGGGAVDAAIATVAALQVTQPCSTGLGGDCFCLYFDRATRAIHALNGSGRSPAALSLERLHRERIYGALPDFHPYTVTVPGAPRAWADLSERFGRLPLSKVLAPAIRIAESGYPVAPLTAEWWQVGAAVQLSKHRHGGELMIDGRGPRPGELMRLPSLASSLRILAEEGSRPFYEGRIAERIVRAVAEAGGVLSLDDLQTHSSEWTTPISVEYRGARVWECPPNGHGLAVLLALGILRHLDIQDHPANDPMRYHLLIEAMRLAFADTARCVADPAFAQAPLDELLSDDYSQARARLVNLDRANRSPMPGGYSMPNPGRDTVYFAVVDAEGNGCSFINSNFMGFGTGIVPEGCGYALQNRGRGFSLDAGHANCLAPRKRPYHTIIPALITDEGSGELKAVLGVMGAMMQPQGHVQVASALLDDNVDPQAALDRPRFQLEEGEAGGAVRLEDAFRPDIVQELGRLGHSPHIVSGISRSDFGLGQIILRDGETWWAGSDPRGDGCALGLLP